jgi:lipopolysaccharide/colanic/teichoic acid biosynthesis glycosyltransferase
MDLALQASAMQAAQSVVLGEAKAKVAVYTRRILKVEGTVALEKDYIQENTFFSAVTLQHAIVKLEADNEYDAILLNPDLLNSDQSAVKQLKQLTKTKVIPVFVYTSNFEEAAKEAALTLGADDYHFGTITTGLYKRVDFLKKLKAYKKQRGTAPYVSQTFDDVPQVKLWRLKRAFDILVSATALMMLSPLLLLIALIIKLESRGPVFYISKRAGSGYKIFDFYKFRSMRVGADKELQNLAHMNQYSGATANANGVFFKIKNDPRITKFGQFIRNTSLDEIPQLFNVLIGDMSLVGNRPLPLYEAEKLTKDQIAWRFLAPAGITGLWQITKRGKDNMSEEERIALDMEYAMKNSLLLDIKIMLKTIPALLQKEKV